MKIKRSKAAEILNELRVMIFRKQFDLLEHYLHGQDISVVKECTGEAHNNPHIDNCMICMPRWGIILDESLAHYLDAKELTFFRTRSAAMKSIESGSLKSYSFVPVLVTPIQGRKNKKQTR